MTVIDCIGKAEELLREAALSSCSRYVVPQPMLEEIGRKLMELDTDNSELEALGIRVSRLTDEVDDLQSDCGWLEDDLSSTQEELEDAKAVINELALKFGPDDSIDKLCQSCGCSEEGCDCFSVE